MDHAAKQRLQEQMVKEGVDVIISTPEEITELSKYASPESQASWRDGVSFGLTYWGSGGDAISIAKIVNDVGGITNAKDIRVKHYGGKPYIIFKGNPRLRAIFTGTRYGFRNKKVMQMGLGRLGAQANVVKAGIITVIFTTGFRIAEFFIDKQTITWLLATLATDFIKIAAACKIGMIAAASFSGAFAIGPLLAVFAVGLATSFIIDKVDSKYSISKAFVAAVEDYVSPTGGFYKAVSLNGSASLQVANALGRGISHQYGLARDMVARNYSETEEKIGRAYSNAQEKIDRTYSDVEEKVLDYVVDELGNFIIRNTHGAFKEFLHRNKYTLVM